MSADQKQIPGTCLEQKARAIRDLLADLKKQTVEEETSQILNAVIWQQPLLT
jgi:hypothetical protein